MRISDWSSDVCSSDLGQGTGNGTQIRDGRTDIVQFHAVKRAASTAKISVGQRREPNAGLTQVGKALTCFLGRRNGRLRYMHACLRPRNTARQQQQQPQYGTIGRAEEREIR